MARVHAWMAACTSRCAVACLARLVQCNGESVGWVLVGVVGSEVVAEDGVAGVGVAGEAVLVTGGSARPARCCGFCGCFCCACCWVADCCADWEAGAADHCVYTK